ncbi:uncharacterized protein K441DRAFT_20263 [Cenococcum geophilum 1.58]|uniref:Uncharacterized protein n=1 Tax=Cenococcum geophilum 1.58 TaxID=794803 RepID=A0ACC8EL08_9PEZI|nr:hypothetical protein K441DRAFT_20263 [Cenococcum geophilum 1.58]
MCGRQYRVYRCGHRVLMPGVLYCNRAGTNRRTGRPTMCGVDRTVTDVADSNLCGRDECYRQDMVDRGWHCHICYHNNFNGNFYCTNPLNNMGRMEPCGHRVCLTHCRYAR